MLLPSQLDLYGITIQTFGLFILFGFFLFSFVVWNEGRKDGFDEEKLFDLILVTIICTLVLSRVVGIWGTVTSAKEYLTKFYMFWAPGYDLKGSLIGFLLPLYFFSKLWKWSFYRIVDIFSLGLSLGISVVVLGFVGLQGKFEYLFAFASWIFLFALLSNVRNIKIKSGYSFSIFLAINALLGLIFFRSKEYLIFYLLLVTLSAVVFVFRWRRSNYDNTIIERVTGRIKSYIRKKEN